jgi:acetylornithine deacetylase/succinyl-diaminopimelate desuccinylase-like protein
MVTAMSGCASGERVSRVPPLTTASASSPAHASTATADDALPLEDEARRMLSELIAIDTSRGDETRALRPIADRLKKAGIRAEIVEGVPGRGNLVARVVGDGSKRPLLLLAHVDVVPTDGQPWTTDPFVPTEKGGFLYGRGVNDDKAMAATFAAIALELARKKTPLARDVIVALTAGEETGGFVGVQWLVKNRRELLDAEIALNEGGSVWVSNDFSHVNSVTIGVAEKVSQNYRMTARGGGGHSSMPAPNADPVQRLAKAIAKVGAQRFPAHVLPYVKDGLLSRAKGEKPPFADALRRAAEGAPKVTPADDAILSANRLTNALIHTTCVTTMLQASPQANVLPTSAEATINCRILPDETVEGTLGALKKAVDDDAIAIETTEPFGGGPPSPIEGEVPAAVRKVALSMWPGAFVHPDMGVGATDSRTLRALGVAAYGIGSGMFSLAEASSGHTAHGPDERRRIEWIAPNVRYLWEVTRTLASR